MGRPKIKIIDDSQLEAEVKISDKKNKQATEAKSGETSQLSEGSAQSANGSLNDSQGGKILSESTSSDVHEQDRTGSERSEESELEKQDKTSEEAKKSKKPQKPGKAKPRSKKYQEAAKDLDRNKLYPLIEAIDLAKKVSYSRNNTTLEAHINTATLGIRGLVSLPFATGRQLRILAFGPSTTPKMEGVIFGTESTIEEINTGPSAGSGLHFDLCLTTPDWMPKLAKIARILGPRGLMPNPKNGTIVSGADGLKKAIEGFQAGKTEYKTEAKAPVIHIVMGKLDQPTEELAANIKTLVQTLGKTRVKKITLSPTMGPGVKVDLSSL